MARHSRPSSARRNRRHHAHVRQTAGEIKVHRARIMTTVSALEPTRTSFWTPAWRAVIFILAAASIWCLLAEMYGLCSMQAFTLRILLPATIALVALAFWD